MERNTESRISLTSNHSGKSWHHAHSSRGKYSEQQTDSGPAAQESREGPLAEGAPAWVLSTWQPGPSTYQAAFPGVLDGG